MTENFLGSSAVYDNTNVTYPVSTGVLETLHKKALNGSLVKYDLANCQKEYAVSFVSKVRNVLLVTNDTDATNNILKINSWYSGDEVSYHWICGDGYSNEPYQFGSPVCTLSIALATANNWTLFGHPISYCMVEPVIEECRLSFSLVIMLAVIAANLTKATIMVWTVWKLREPTLVTIGDAVASFLEQPDPTTAGICLSTKMDIIKGKWKKKIAKRWAPERHFWFKAASFKRWLTCYIL